MGQILLVIDSDNQNINFNFRDVYRRRGGSVWNFPFKEKYVVSHVTQLREEKIIATVCPCGWKINTLLSDSSSLLATASLSLMSC